MIPSIVKDKDVFPLHFFCLDYSLIHASISGLAKLVSFTIQIVEELHVSFCIFDKANQIAARKTFIVVKSIAEWLPSFGALGAIPVIYCIIFVILLLLSDIPSIVIWARKESAQVST